MTRGRLCHLLQQLIVVGPASRHVYSPSSRNMLKRPAQSPSESETCQREGPASPAAGSLGRSDGQRSPFNVGPDLPSHAGDTTMPEIITAEHDGDRRRVEYLETPVKSEMDKKEYRYWTDDVGDGRREVPPSQAPLLERSSDDATCLFFSLLCLCCVVADTCGIMRDNNKNDFYKTAISS